MIERHLNNGAKAQTPYRVVVHSMGEYIEYNGEILHAVDLLESLGLSAHILVSPDGAIIKCRDDSEGAYHAMGFNKNSLGIEFLVKGEQNYRSFKEAIKTPYLTDKQYQSGMEFIRDEWWVKKGIRKIDRHSDIDPDRKVDPGEGFPWDRLIREIGLHGGKNI